MNVVTRLAVAVVLVAAAFDSALAQACPEGSLWERTWTDSWGQTTYRISAPCKVYVTIPFDVVLTVTDSVHPNTSVGALWSIVDNGAVIEGGGFNWIDTVAGQWSRVKTITYTGAPIDHTIEFRFKDLGQGMGAHGFANVLIGALTVDPYPPSPNAAPVADAGPDRTLARGAVATSFLEGVAADDDGDALTYRWLLGDGEVMSSRPVESSGAAPLALAGLDLAAGSHLFTLEVSDGLEVAQDSVVVTVTVPPPNVAPNAYAGADLRILETQQGTMVLAGHGVDVGGDALTYRWLEGEVELQMARPVASSGDAPLDLSEIAPLTPGDHVLTLEVTDGIHVATDEVVLSVDAAPTAPSTGGCGSAGGGASMLAMLGLAAAGLHRGFSRASARRR